MKIDIKKIVKAWIKSSDEDLNTAQGLFQLERYSGCLFFCHLSIEKIIKAIYLKNKKLILLTLIN